MNDSGCTRPVSVRNMRIESVPFSDLPDQSRLFLEYQEDVTALRQFYPSSVGSPLDLLERVDEVLSNYKSDRDEVCNALDRINRELGAGPEVLSNIELLRDPRSVAVLTGQQTGLFTGPLYSIYKALSAVKMAECLKARGVNAVPLFWMATEDHDLAEVSTAAVISDDNNLFESIFAAGGSAEGLPVGVVELTEMVGSGIDEMFSILPSTEFSTALKTELRETWGAGMTFGKAFGSFLVRLLGRYGLVVVDPIDGELKNLASPIYVDAVSKSHEITASLIARNNELAAAGYHAQVLVEDGYFPLFWHTDDGVRTALRREPSGRLKAKGRSDSLSEEELAEIAALDPARLSPGVMLRPVVQDYLFPTICYFGGSAEVAYFAQNSEVYRIMDRPVTPILHRQSFTIVEAKHARTMAKYDLSFTDLFDGEEAVIGRVIDGFIDPQTAAVLTVAENEIDLQLDRIDSILSRLDPTLSANLATRRRKITYHLAALRKKYYSRRASTEGVIDRRVKAAFTTLLPKGQLQERVLNIASFLDRFGPGFVDWIYDSIDLEDKGHRVIFI